ncbi:hypothetical protein M8C21_017545, partial [Ambrosia artemisiifolia]
RGINRGRERFDDREKGSVNAPVTYPDSPCYTSTADWMLKKQTDYFWFDAVDGATYTMSTMKRPTPPG